ncbi:MAG: M56 family metallopeptidase [Fimbriimonadaceae bacterium]|nr:M56 family metallopeptidase [Fimbriimonadaceae bacterium]
MSGYLADPLARWLIQSFAATFVIGLLGWVAIRLTRSAAVRLAVAAWGLGCCLAIPMLSWLVMRSGQSLTRIEIPAPPSLPVVAAETPLRDSIVLPAGAPVEVVETSGEPLVQPDPVEIPWLTLGLVTYLAGLGFGVLRLGFGLLRLRSILRHSRPGPDIKGFDRVRISDNVTHPFVCGLRRSTLLLPSDLTSRLDPREFEQVVAHEREHVRGRHAWLGILQRVAALVLWPQPMAHVLAHELKAAQEEVCDNAALRGGNPSDYARMLVDLAERRTDRMPSGLAYGIFGSQPPLEKRIRGLLDPRRSTEPTMKHTTRTAVFGTALSITMILAGVQLVTAQEQVREVIGVPLQTDQAVEVQGYPIAVVEGFRLQPDKAAKQANAPKAKKSVRGTKELKAALAEAQRQVRSYEAMLERVQGYKLVPSDRSPLNKIEYKRVPVTTPLTRYRSFMPSTGFTLASPRVKVEGVPILKDVPVIGHLYKGATTVTVPQAESLYRMVSPKVDYVVTQEKPIYKMAAPKLDMSNVKPLYTTPKALAGGTRVIQGEPARIVEGQALAPSQPGVIAAPNSTSSTAPRDAAIAVSPARTTIKKPAANRKPISVLKGATVILYSDGTTEIRPATKVTKKPTKAKSTKRGK